MANASNSHGSRSERQYRDKARHVTIGDVREDLLSPGPLQGLSSRSNHWYCQPQLCLVDKPAVHDGVPKAHGESRPL